MCFISQFNVFIDSFEISWNLSEDRIRSVFLIQRCQSPAIFLALFWSHVIFTMVYGIISINFPLPVYPIYSHNSGYFVYVQFYVFSLLSSAILLWTEKCVNGIIKAISSWNLNDFDIKFVKCTNWHCKSPRRAGQFIKFHEIKLPGG